MITQPSAMSCVALIVFSVSPFDPRRKIQARLDRLTLTDIWHAYLSSLARTAARRGRRRRPRSGPACGRGRRRPPRRCRWRPARSSGGGWPASRRSWQPRTRVKSRSSDKLPRGRRRTAREREREANVTDGKEGKGREDILSSAILPVLSASGRLTTTWPFQPTP